MYHPDDAMAVRRHTDRYPPTEHERVARRLAQARRIERWAQWSARLTARLYRLAQARRTAACSDLE